MFKSIIAGLIGKLANAFTGRLVTKAVTAAAVWLIAHHAMTTQQQGAWVAANADVITGAVLGVVSCWLSIWQHGKAQQAIQTALMTPVPAQPTTNFSGGGVVAGATNIGGNPH